MRRNQFIGESGSFSYLRWHDQSSLPKLHFTHATGFNSLTYRSILGPIAQYYDLYCIDLRGHGFTEADANPDRFRSWQLYENDLSEFIHSMEGSIVLAGHSVGAIVSLGVAYRNPDKVRSLVLFEPVFIEPRFAGAWRWAKKLGLGSKMKMSQQARRRRSVWSNKEQIFNAYQGRGAFRTWPDHILKDYIDGGTRVDQNGGIRLSCDPRWEARSFAVTSHSAWYYLKRVKCPGKPWILLSRPVRSL